MRSWTSIFRSNRKPIRRRHGLGASFGRLEDRSLLTAGITASLQTGGVLDIEGTNGADTITVRLINGNYSVDGIAATFATGMVQSIRINALGGDDHINLHTEGALTTGNKTAFIVLPGGQTNFAQPITVPTEIHGGTGNDTIDGGEGPDAIFGGAGNDVIRGWDGADYIDGGVGDDTIQGGAAGDTIFGDLGNNTIDGGTGVDRIYGGPETNTVTDPDQTGQINLGSDLIQSLALDDALRERARYLQIDGSLSRNDMLALFNVAAQDGTISYGEIQSLSRLDDYGPFLGMPDSVRVLTEKVIGYDPANKMFGAIPLEANGMLNPGDSSDKFGLLISKWFEGGDRPVAANDSGTTTFNYVSVQGTLFHNQTITIQGPTANGLGISYTRQFPLYTDVVQGDTGDCYFVASLAGVARSNPQAILNMFTDNGDGTYTVRLFLNGRADYVTVDRELPETTGGNFAFANDGQSVTNAGNVLWVALAEKAYAQFNASGTIAQDGTNSYQGIAEGRGDVAYAQITGSAEDQHNFGDSGASQANMIAALNAGKVVTWGTQDSPPNVNVVPQHLYLVTGYDATTGQFQLYNPWGLNGGSYGGRKMPGTLSLTYQELSDNGDFWYGSQS